MQHVNIIPSVLERTVSAARRRIDELKQLDVPLHLDLMDGRFVTTRSFGPKSIMQLDVPPHTTAHLMVDEPIPWINACWRIGIRQFVLHVESRGVSPHAVRNVHKLFDITMAIDPGTPISLLRPYVPHISGFHVMTVKPGRQGNLFIPSQLTVVKRLRRQHNGMPIAVDGGMNETTIPLAVAAGVERIIVGSALTHVHDLRKKYRQLSSL